VDIDPNAQPQAAQIDGIPPNIQQQMASHVAMLKAQGLAPDLIKQHLVRTFGLGQ
jgi:hypothetical protein